jgi:hypothetical protein
VWVETWLNPVFDFSACPNLSRIELKMSTDVSLSLADDIFMKLRGSTTLEEVALDLWIDSPPDPGPWMALNSTFSTIRPLKKLEIDLSSLLGEHWEQTWEGKDEEMAAEVKLRYDTWSDIITDCLPHFTGESPDVYFSNEEPLVHACSIFLSCFHGLPEPSRFEGLIYSTHNQPRSAKHINERHDWMKTEILCLQEKHGQALSYETG